MSRRNKKRAYARLLLDPDCRLTKEEMAKRLRVNLATLEQWERQAGLGQIPRPPVKPAEDEWTKLKSVLYEKALEGDVPSAKLLLQMRDLNLSRDTARGISLEQALALISDYLSKARTSSTTSDSES